MSLANASQTAPALGTLAEVWIYPIKSCAGLRVPQATLLATGLQWDRHWMLVDPGGRFVTQRTVPQMAHLHITLTDHEMRVQAAHQPTLAPWVVGLSRVEAATTAANTARPSVQVWQSTVPALDEGDAAADWFSQALGRPVRLVRFDDAERRVCNPEWPGDKPAHTQFADGFPLLVTTAASIPVLNARLQAAGEAAVDMRRFRANVVLDGFGAHAEDEMTRIAVGDAALLQPVKPCTRCPMPDVNPDTAQTGRSVRQALRDYRTDPHMNGALTFGQNAIVLAGEGSVLREGMRIQAW